MTNDVAQKREILNDSKEKIFRNESHERDFFFSQKTQAPAQSLPDLGFKLRYDIFSFWYHFVEIWNTHCYNRDSLWDQLDLRKLQDYIAKMSENRVSVLIFLKADLYFYFSGFKERFFYIHIHIYFKRIYVTKEVVIVVFIYRQLVMLEFTVYRFTYDVSEQYIPVNCYDGSVLLGHLRYLHSNTPGVIYIFTIPCPISKILNQPCFIW